MLPGNFHAHPPPVIIPAPRRPGIWPWVLGAGGGLLLAAYYFFNPGETAWFPGCQFYRLTGILCPGCGGQRALHFLLHGEVGAAFHHNALFVLGLPPGGWLAGRLLQAWRTGRPLPAFCHHRFTPWLLLGLLIGFGLVRNLPWLSGLRPGV